MALVSIAGRQETVLSRPLSNLVHSFLADLSPIFRPRFSTSFSKILFTNSSCLEEKIEKEGTAAAAAAASLASTSILRHPLSDPTSNLVQLAKLFNNFYFSNNNNRYKPLFCQGHQIGLVGAEIEAAIEPFKDVFSIGKDHVDILYSSNLTRDEDIYTEITRNVAIALNELRKSNDFVALRGWRNESYYIRPSFHDKPLFEMERSATCMFGLRQYGVDVNGYVIDAETGSVSLWLQRRSLSKPTWPGFWDNFVSGGLSAGYGVLETVLKEAREEADVPEHLLTTKLLKPAGCVTFFFQSERGVFPQTEFVFDLELPADFSPKNNDGEVDEFALVPADKVVARICEPDMKTTSCPVVLDFLIRKGFVNTENESNLPLLTELLHIPLHRVYEQHHHG